MAGTKQIPNATRARALELHAAGLSPRNIVTRLRAEGHKAGGRTTVDAWIKSAARPIRQGPPAPVAAADTDDPATLVARLLADAEAQRSHAHANGEPQVALAHSKHVADLLTLQVRMRGPAASDPELVVMKRSDVEFSAERCRAKLHDLLARQLAKREETTNA